MCQELKGREVVRVMLQNKYPLSEICKISSVIEEEVLFKELVDGILSIFGSQVIRIVLYGSVARGTNTVESDIDIALLLNGGLSKVTEDRLSDLVVDLNLKYDTVLSVIDIDYEMFRKWEKVIPFYKNVNGEGIVLWKAA